MQMTGTEISAENPGLTAGAGARLSLTPSGLCHGCRGGGCRWELRGLDPGPGRGGDAGKWSWEEPRSWRQEAGSSRATDFFGKGCGEGGVSRKRCPG